MTDQETIDELNRALKQVRDDAKLITHSTAENETDADRIDRLEDAVIAIAEAIQLLAELAESETRTLVNAAKSPNIPTMDEVIRSLNRG